MEQGMASTMAFVPIALGLTHAPTGDQSGPSH